MLRTRNLSLLNHDAEVANAVMYAPALALQPGAKRKQVSRMKIG
jgi:hypothetical protein